MIHYIKQETELLFPVPLWKFNLPGCKNTNKNIEKRVYEKSKEVKEPDDGRDGLSEKRIMNDDPVMEPVTALISAAIKEISYESNMTYSNYKTFLWSNLNRPGVHNEMHAHPDSHLSGVYYVKVPEGDCGNLRFYNPMNHYGYPNSNSNDPPSQQVKVIDGEEGALLIFRSPIMHDITKNNTQEDRISISFNILFETYYKSGDSKPYKWF